MPWLATAFVVVTLSSIGLPGTNGFVGEFLILSGTFLSRLADGQVLAVVASTGVILGAVYMLVLVEKVFFGPIRHEENRHLADLSVREGFVLAPVIVFIVVMGLMPGPFLAPAKPAVDRLVQRFQQAEARLGLPDRRSARSSTAVAARPRPVAREGRTDMTGFPIRDFVALVPVAILACGGAGCSCSPRSSWPPARRGYQAGAHRGDRAAGGRGRRGRCRRPAPSSAARPPWTPSRVFVTVIICAGVALSALVSAGWLHARDAERGEFYALTLFAASGMALLGMASDLLVAFVAIEIMSLSTYALAAYMRRGRRPSEAAFKYMILGAVSSALLLYGSVAALRRHRHHALLRPARRPGAPARCCWWAGSALVASGLAFKVGAVPFHAWTPDVYEGAPTPVTAFMAAGVKTAAFALLARLFLSAQAGRRRRTTSPSRRS